MQVDFWKHKPKGLKLNWVLALLGGVTGLGLLAWMLSPYQIDVLISPAPEPTVENADTNADTTELPPAVSFAPVETVPTPGSPLWNPTPSSPAPAIAGLLRVSNQTQHPIRVVLRKQIPVDKAGFSDRPTYEAAPAHWDFAPAEGSQQGLVVSLPEGEVRVGPGDILMVYAQDGSSRYWGPTVVSQTQQPVWNPTQQEWQLIVRP